MEGLHDLPENTVIDGEVVGLDDSGRPDFNLLQSSRSHASRIHYFVFDLLIYKNRVSRLALGFGFFIGLYGSRSKDSCSHFLLPFVTPRRAANQ